jgi:hypothetical protein
MQEIDRCRNVPHRPPRRRALARQVNRSREVGRLAICTLESFSVTSPPEKPSEQHHLALIGAHPDRRGSALVHSHRLVSMHLHILRSPQRPQRTIEDRGSPYPHKAPRSRLPHCGFHPRTAKRPHHALRLTTTPALNMWTCSVCETLGPDAPSSPSRWASIVQARRDREQGACLVRR